MEDGRSPVANRDPLSSIQNLCLGVSVVNSLSMKTQPIILDTDIGDDIDDALALAVALNSPELELRGVTTVFRNAPRRALLAQEMLRVFKRSDVPVLAGCSKPLLQPFDPQLGAQFAVLERDTLEQPTQHAVDFIVQSVDIAAEPDPENLLTLVPIGPLTNIALALAREPELIPRCRIVLMGGQWRGETAEWNIRCDPEAAAMVFNSGAEIHMVGLDVTTRCRLDQSHIAQFAEQDTARGKLLAELIRLWQNEIKHRVTLHDPLTLLTLFDDCVTFEEKRIEIDLCGNERGKTIVAKGEPNARVAVDVDVDRAIELFMERALA